MTQCPHCRQVHPWPRRLLCLKWRARWNCRHCGALLKCGETRRVCICVGCALTFIALVILPFTRPWAMRLTWSLPAVLLTMSFLIAEFDQLIVIEVRDIRCPECGYNLKGLSAVRCPECGKDLDDKKP